MRFFIKQCHQSWFKSQANRRCFPVWSMSICTLFVRDFLKEEIGRHIFPPATGFEIIPGLKKLQETLTDSFSRIQIQHWFILIYNLVEHKHKLPQSQLEAHLMRCWEDILGTHELGISDNFFWIRRGFTLSCETDKKIESLAGYHCPISLLLEYPTIDLQGKPPLGAFYCWIPSILMRY